MDQTQLCPRFEKAIDILSKRWTALIVFQLLSGPQRFSEIGALLPNLSGKVLTERLRELESEGLVRRDVFPDIPVRIEYSLTDKGLALAPLFEDIGQWATKWIELPAE